jgi:hypothetical protein
MPLNYFLKNLNKLACIKPVPSLPTEPGLNSLFMYKNKTKLFYYLQKYEIVLLIIIKSIKLLIIKTMAMGFEPISFCPTNRHFTY